MRILLTHHLPLEGSPSGRATRDLAAGLSEAGHDVLCLVVQGRGAPQATAAAPQAFALESVRCWPGDRQAELAFDVPCLGAHAFTRLTFDELRDDQLVDYRNALRRKLDRAIERFDPHLIHCQHAWLFAHLALESGAPYVISIWGPELRATREGPRYRRFVEQAIENASRVLVHNRFAAAETAALFPDSASRIEHVPPPIRIEHPSPGPTRAALLAALGICDDGPLLVAAGDLLPETGMDTLLNAHAALAAGGRAASLAVCGYGPQRCELEAQARHQQLQRVHFLGELPDAQRASLWEAADLAVVPACPAAGFYTALEALACGTPVIAANCGALPELVDERIGALVERGDHELLAEVLLRALAENWKQSKGPAARQAAAAFAFSGSVARHVALYEAALVQRYGSQPLP